MAKYNQIQKNLHSSSSISNPENQESGDTPFSTLKIRQGDDSSNLTLFKQNTTSNKAMRYKSMNVKKNSTGDKSPITGHPSLRKKLGLNINIISTSKAAMGQDHSNDAKTPTRAQQKKDLIKYLSHSNSARNSKTKDLRKSLTGQSNEEKE